MAITIADLTTKFDMLRGNPVAMQRLMLNTLEDVSLGARVIVNPTSPFTFLMEAACSVASAGMLQDETLVRRLYASNARSDEDVYLHMSDDDFLNRFSTPARTSFTLLLSLDEIRAKAVAVGDGTYKLTIPRHSEYIIAGLIFTMQYPLDIRILPSGGVSLYYDVSRKSPIVSLESNRVDWGMGSHGGSKFLRITMPVSQMLITTQVAQLNNITGLYKEYDFTDQYYYCRAFIKLTADSNWTEIRTTHTEQVYDPNTPTVVLRVLNSRLAVKVPQIYFNNGSIKDSLRIDIYTTKGPLELNLSSYPATSYSARWLDHDAVNDNAYSAPLSTFSGVSLFMEGAITGGSNAVSFDTLRKRVITNGLNNPTLPITQAQLSTVLSSLGYDVVTNLDNITDRQFIAVRALPAPTNSSTVSGAGCAIRLLESKLTDLVQYGTIENHGERVTIKPNTLFKSIDGVLSVVTDTERLRLLDPLVTPPDVLANQVNDGNYYFTPFYYVLDVANNQFTTRVYRLDKPSITSKYFFQTNTALLVDASTLSYGVEVNSTGSGYRLLIEAAVSDVYSALALDQVFLQLSYVPPGTQTRVYFNGVLRSPIDGSTGKPVGKRYIYSFDLDTTYDVNQAHQLTLTGPQAPMALSTEFDLVYIVRDHQPSGAGISDIDAIVDKTILPGYTPSSVYLGATQERITIKVGEHLKHLWTRSRSAVGALTYLKHTVDVPAIYTETVYARDPLTGAINMTYNNDTGEFGFTVLHAKGAPVMDSLGDPVYKYKAGDVVMDANGDPVLAGGVQGMLRQLDLCLIDGRYYFATNETTLAYKQEMIDLITNWCVVDLETIAGNLLERSEIYYYPKTTTGLLDVIVNDQQHAQIPAAQTFRVTYYVRQDIYENQPIREALSERTADILAAAMERSTISVTDITATLKAALGDEVLSVNVSGFANDLYPTVTLKDPSMQPVVGKRLVSLSNQTLAVQDAVVNTFINHLPKSF